MDDVVDSAFVAWVDAALTAFEDATGARCPIRGVPLDLVAEAVRARAVELGVDPPTALRLVVGRYCEGYLPARVDMIEVSSIDAPGGGVTFQRPQRDGS